MARVTAGVKTLTVSMRIRSAGRLTAKPGFLADFLFRCLFVFVDIENLAKLHQTENFFDVLIDVTHAQCDFCGLAFFAK